MNMLNKESDSKGKSESYSLDGFTGASEPNVNTRNTDPNLKSAGTSFVTDKSA